MARTINKVGRAEYKVQKLWRSLLLALRSKIQQMFSWEEVEVTFTNHPISSYSYKKVD